MTDLTDMTGADMMPDARDPDDECDQDHRTCSCVLCVEHRANNDNYKVAIDVTDWIGE